jgi:hypothetical protein
MIMDPRAIDRDLEQRGFSAFTALGPLAASVSAAYARKAGDGGVHDLVLVVDRTDGSGEGAGQSHRASARLGPFSASLDELRGLGRALPTSFFRPLTRVTIVEIAAGAASNDDRRRLAVYTTPARGKMFVAAAYVDVEAKTLLSTDGASPPRTGLLNADDPTVWVRDVLGLTKLPYDEVPRAEPVALFAPRTVGFASFLCSPVAGAALLGWNFSRTRRPGIALLLFVLASAVLALVAYATSDAIGRLLGVVMTFGGMGLFTAATRRSFGQPVRRPGTGFAILLSLGSLILLFLVGVGSYVALHGLTQRSVRTEHGAKVVYDDGTIPSEAEKVGAVLEERGVLPPGSEVTVETHGKAHRILVVLADVAAAKRPEVQLHWRDTAEQVSTEVFLRAPVSVVFTSEFGSQIGEMITAP